MSSSSNNKVHIVPTIYKLEEAILYVGSAGDRGSAERCPVYGTWGVYGVNWLMGLSVASGCLPEIAALIALLLW